MCVCVFEEGIWVNEKSSHKVQPPWFHLQLVAQRQAGVHMQLQGRKTRWQVQKFSHCFRLTLHATTIRHTLGLWKCQGEPHLRLYIKLWVAGISTVEYQNGNKRIGGCRGGCCKREPRPLPHPPWWICTTDPRRLAGDKLWHGPLFRCTNPWMVVIITGDTMKSILWPATCRWDGIFKCHNRKIKSNVLFSEQRLHTRSVRAGSEGGEDGWPEGLAHWMFPTTKNKK